ncbi:hypothetical protein V1477_002570 [Vespula maculifrons]|uniref:Uncharacterized protein n=1 Tax=Vespula maculifrons TaxID=7453 RepID=A0ABD2CWZ8_VESMC
MKITVTILETFVSLERFYLEEFDLEPSRDKKPLMVKNIEKRRNDLSSLVIENLEDGYMDI